MEYGYKKYKTPLQKIDMNNMPNGFAIMMPTKEVTKKELDEYAKIKLADIMNAYGVQFHEVQSQNT